MILDLYIQKMIPQVKKHKNRKMAADTSSSSDVSKLRNSKETEISSTVSINIENSDKVAKKSKKDMRKKSEENDKVASEAKPKLVIKIPKPFALGYWIIDLSKLLGNLVKGLLAAVTALLLAAISALLAELLQKILDSGADISQSDIDNGLNSMDMNALIDESQKEYERQQKLLSDSLIDPNIKGKGDGKVVDLYGSANKNKKNISKKKKYTIDRRNRKDILDSDVVNERNGSNNKNIKTVKNPNYGTYID